MLLMLGGLRGSASVDGVRRKHRNHRNAIASARETRETLALLEVFQYTSSAQ